MRLRPAIRRASGGLVPVRLELEVDRDRNVQLIDTTNRSRVLKHPVTHLAGNSFVLEEARHFLQDVAVKLRPFQRSNDAFLHGALVHAVDELRMTKDILTERSAVVLQLSEAAIQLVGVLVTLQ